MFMPNEQYETYKTVQEHQDYDAALAAENQGDSLTISPLVEEFYRKIEVEIEDHNREVEEEK